MTPAASATVNCSSSAHCYVIVQWDPANQGLGHKLQLYYSKLSTNISGTNSVQIEGWTGTWNSYISWVEAGFSSGYPMSVTTPYWFWAEQAPGLPYAEHDKPAGTSAPANTYVTSQIRYRAGNAWDLSFNGTVYGTSYNQPPYATWQEAGIEGQGYACASGQVNTLQYFDNHNILTDGWPYSVPTEQNTNAEGNISWVNTYHHATFSLQPYLCNF